MKDKTLLGIIIFGLAVKLTILLVLFSSNPQTWEYDTIADNILKGHGYQMEHLGAVHYSQAPPLYAFVCAGIYALTNHSYLAVQLFQIILSCFIVLTVYAIGNTVFNKTIGLLAAFLVTFHPGLIVYAIWKIHPLNLDSLLILLVILGFLKTRVELFSWKVFLLGAVTGLAILTRPTIALFLPFGIACLALQKEVNKKKFIIFCCVLLSTVALVISPWIIRNYLIHKRIIFITTDTGELFWRGNNPGASGSAYLPSGKTVLENMPEELVKKIYGKPELAQKDVFTKEALNFIKKNPEQAIRLFLKKFLYFWWFSPQSGILYSKSWFNFYKLYYSIVILFGIIGLTRIFYIRNLQVLRNTCFLLLMLLSISFAQSLFYVEGRHRWAVEPLVLIFTAVGFISIIEKIKNGHCREK